MIIVEKDCSRLIIDKLMESENKVTVLANVKKTIINRIARLTQTVACPSINLIDESFITGHCH